MEGPQGEALVPRLLTAAALEAGLPRSGLRGRAGDTILEKVSRGWWDADRLANELEAVTSAAHTLLKRYSCCELFT